MGKAGLGNGSLSLGERELHQAGDLCFRPCVKLPEDCLPSPGQISILSFWNIQKVHSAPAARASSGPKLVKFCSHNLAASSGIFAISADLCNTMYKKPDLKCPDHSLQHILQEWRSRGMEQYIIKAFRV